ncbi:hypothetical protein B0I35DRAFT_171569 [Stachybotrys elegans]|uniref:Uncharacterized protein n=1 Tax=Stachybotrys elegans TaxID=80388 RepID=A0A8K0SWW4_9HYPO|nr:hypothetical protein B0I35DRAFT_171569 [Stachybotrys elegans]
MSEHSLAPPKTPDCFLVAFVFLCGRLGGSLAPPAFLVFLYLFLFHLLPCSPSPQPQNHLPTVIYWFDIVKDVFLEVTDIHPVRYRIGNSHSRLLPSAFYSRSSITVSTATFMVSVTDYILFVYIPSSTTVSELPSIVDCLSFTTLPSYSFCFSCQESSIDLIPSLPSEGASSKSLVCISLGHTNGKSHTQDLQVRRRPHPAVGNFDDLARSCESTIHYVIAEEEMRLRK